MDLRKLKTWILVYVIIGLIGVIGMPSSLSAQGSADLHAQINNLLLQLGKLQQQLIAFQSGQQMNGLPNRIPQGFVFASDLAEGTTSTEVKYLQIALNMDTATQVAVEGFGAPGNESSYFGNRTKAGLIRFQQKYASEILTPQGKTLATGVFDEFTKAKLNRILAGIPAGSPSAVASPSVSPTAGVLIALAPDTPMGGTIASGTRSIFTKFTMTALEREARIISLTISHSGLSTNEDVENIQLLDENGIPLGNNVSLNANAKATMIFLPALRVPVGAKRTFSIQADIPSGVTTGKTVVLGIQETVDIQAENMSVQGMFPLQGKSFSVLQMGIASMQVREDDPIFDVAPNVGRKEAFLNQFAVMTGDEEAVVIDRITALHAGSSFLSESKNLKLYDLTNKKLIKTVSFWSADGRVIWDNLKIVLKRGETRRFRILADVAGGAGRTLNADITDGDNVLIAARGLQYGFSPSVVAVGNWDGKGRSDQHIREGLLTIKMSDKTPNAHSINPGKDYILASFDFIVRGEPVRVKSLQVSFDWSEGVLPAHIRDIRLVDSDGRTIAGPQDANAQIYASDEHTYEGKAVFTIPFEIPVGTKTYSIVGNVSPNAPAGGNVTVGIVNPASDIAAQGVASGDMIEPQPAGREVRGNRQSF